MTALCSRFIFLFSTTVHGLPISITQEKLYNYICRGCVWECMIDLWPRADMEKGTAATRRHFSCWLTRKFAELGVILLCPLTLLNYLCVIPLSLLAALSFTWLAGVQEWLSVAKSNRGSQIHNTPCGISQASCEQLLIFQRTLHYHSDLSTQSINSEALGWHA